MEGERDAGGVSEHQLELARTAKEAFDYHRYLGLFHFLKTWCRHIIWTSSVLCPGTRAACLP